MAPPNSILADVKNNLDVEEDNVDFDGTIKTYINGAFSTLHQLGIGPEGGYAILDGNDTWDAFYGTNKRYNGIRTYVTLAVRMLFDPPQTGHHLTAMQNQLNQLEWRLNVVREGYAWIDPTPVPLRSTVLYGGDA